MADIVDPGGACQTAVGRIAAPRCGLVAGTSRRAVRVRRCSPAASIERIPSSRIPPIMPAAVDLAYRGTIRGYKWAGGMSRRHLRRVFRQRWYGSGGCRLRRLPGTPSAPNRAGQQAWRRACYRGSHLAAVAPRRRSAPAALRYGRWRAPGASSLTSTLPARNAYIPASPSSTKRSASGSRGIFSSFGQSDGSSSTGSCSCGDHAATTACTTPPM